jgi:hypothetical protein
MSPGRGTAAFPASQHDMAKFLLCVLLICSFAVTASTQGQQTPRTHSSRVLKQHPSVYITLGRIGKIASPEIGEVEDRVWLRLHNNTRWALWHKAHGWTTKQYGDGGVFYDIENVQTHEIRIGNRCHACSFIPLA